jgi:hypothetical protein
MNSINAQLPQRIKRVALTVTHSIARRAFFAVLILILVSLGMGAWLLCATVLPALNFEPSAAGTPYFSDSLWQDVMRETELRSKIFESVQSQNYSNPFYNLNNQTP